MNITSSSSPAFLVEENNLGSDSDTNPEDDSPDYYQPISSLDEEDPHEEQDEVEEEEDLSLPVDGDGHSHGLSNGHITAQEALHQISSIALNGGSEHKSDSEEEEEMEREAPESEIRRAFREDERRRRSPLTAENAARVMEAMRAVSFPGTAPDWVSNVPEDRWIHHLHGLRSNLQDHN